MEDIVLHYEDLRDSAGAFLVSYHRDAGNYLARSLFLLSIRLEDKPEGVCVFQTRTRCVGIG